MTLDSLVGRLLRVLDADGSGKPAMVVVRNVDSAYRALQFEFVTPLALGSRSYRFAVAQTRLRRDSLELLLEGASILCSVTYVSDDRYDLTKPFDVSWWRGGGAVISDLVLEKYRS